MTSLATLEELLSSAQKNQDWGQVALLSHELRGVNPRSQAYYVLEARGLFRAGDVHGAIAVIEEACKKFPKNSSAWINRAEFLSQGASRETQLQLYVDIVEKFPDHRVAHIHSSQVFSRLNEHEIARDSAYAAHRLEPMVSTCENLIVVLGAGGYLEDALNIAKEMREEFPDAAAGYTGPIMTLIRLENFNEAYRLGREWFQRETPKKIGDYKVFSQLFLKAFNVTLENPQDRIDLLESLMLEPKELNTVRGCSSFVLDVQSMLHINRSVFTQITKFLDINIYPYITSSKWEIVRSRVSLGLNVTEPYKDVINCILDESGFVGLCRNFSAMPLFSENVEKLKVYLKSLTPEELPTGNVLDVLEIAYLLYIPLADRDPEITNRFNTQVPVRTSQITDPLNRPLRIAVCVSGQLRGYKNAFPSWEALGLDEHETDYYVHTWKEIGRKYPIASHASRCFTGQFLKAYQDTLLRHRTDELESLFPSLYNCFLKEGIVTKADLDAVYSPKQVVIEDDQSGDFKSFSNPKKMYYKIQRCWELVEQSGREYDLIVRIRPDKWIEDAGQKIDWHAAYEKCKAEPIIHVDGIFHLHVGAGLILGDQFAFGTPEVMREYSIAYDNTLDRKHPMQKYKSSFGAHSNVALSVYFAGLIPTAVTAVNFRPPIDPEIISADVLLECIKSDITNRAPAVMDQAWLSALTQDIAGRRS